MSGLQHRHASAHSSTRPHAGSTTDSPLQRQPAQRAGLRAPRAAWPLSLAVSLHTNDRQGCCWVADHHVGCTRIGLQSVHAEGAVGHSARPRRPPAPQQRSGAACSQQAHKVLWHRALVVGVAVGVVVVACAASRVTGADHMQWCRAASATCLAAHGAASQLLANGPPRTHPSVTEVATDTQFRLLLSTVVVAAASVTVAQPCARPDSNPGMALRRSTKHRRAATTRGPRNARPARGHFPAPCVLTTYHGESEVISPVHRGRTRLVSPGMWAARGRGWVHAAGASPPLPRHHISGSRSMK